MSWSFFIGTETELVSGSKLFAAKINASPEAYGLSPELAGAYAAVDAVWQAAFVAARDPQTRTRSKVIGKNLAKAQVKAMASTLAKIIAGTPAVSDAQRIGLGLSVRGPRSPRAEPGKPTDFSMKLDGNGALLLKWKCKNPVGTQGTIYHLWRQIDRGEFAYCGVTGRKQFLDNTLPPGAASVAYRVRAMRSTKWGELAEYNIHFGVKPGTPVTSLTTKAHATQQAA